MGNHDESQRAKNLGIGEIADEDVAELGVYADDEEVVRLVHDRPWASVQISRSTKGEPAWVIKLYQDDDDATPMDTALRVVELDRWLKEQLEPRWR